MTKSLARCPDCAGQVRLIGAISATDMFAGRVLERPLAGGFLYRCRQCALGFRWPQMGKNELDTLYSQGSEVAWVADRESRGDWVIACDWLEQDLVAGSRILDVGCSDGAFFEPLLDSYRCSGIEIHAAARSRAESKGIEIIGGDFSAITGSFDCITAFDVIEHVVQPKSFLNACLAALRPGGWLLISTGNLDASTFRMSGSRYWYCAIAEHISFVSPAWFSGLAGDLGYRIARQSTFAHSSTSVSRRISEAASNLLYRICPSGFRALRALGLGGKNVKAHAALADHPPAWVSAHDHFMVLLQKDEHPIRDGAG